MNNVRLPIITFSEPFTYLGVGASAGTQTPPCLIGTDDQPTSPESP